MTEILAWRSLMMKKINIKYMSDEVLETIKENPEKYSSIMLDNPDSNDWLINEFKNPFVEKKLTIADFDFYVDDKENKKDLSFVNSVLIHKVLKNLPPYVLSDEHFWAWINFDKGYTLSQILMPPNKNSSRLKNHYFFGAGGIRRGMFFGVISRLFFRAHLTFDAQNEDPYELTKYVNENPLRFRNLTWRTYSNSHSLVKSILKIQYKLELLYKEKMTTKIFEEIAKYVSQLGSLTYVELIEEKDLEAQIFKKVQQLFLDNEITS
jgi:hypothetical protein